MTEIFYLLPPQTVFTSTQRVLLRNGFRLEKINENSHLISATKKEGLFGPKLKVDINVTERDGHTLLEIETSSTRSALGLFSGKPVSSLDKLIDQLNTHIK